MNLKSKPIILVYIAVAVIIVAAGFWYWQSKKTTQTAPTASTPVPTMSVTEEAGGSIGAVIFEKTQDPLKENIPETNPLKNVIKNPF